MRDHLTESTIEIPVRERPLVALIGQPNSGKTTLFNALTGSFYKTSNYAGTTAESYEGELTDGYDWKAHVIDTPGVAGTHVLSSDEDVAYRMLFEHPTYRNPDVVIISVDASQLARQLHLARYLIQCGLPVVVALTMNDILRNSGLNVEVEKLSAELGVPVVKVNPRVGHGLRELMQSARATASSRQPRVIRQLKPLTESGIISSYEWAEEVQERVLSSVYSIPILGQRALDVRKPAPDPHSLKLDRVLLHPVWGFVLFAGTMFLLFSSVFWLAQPAMDAVSDGMTSLADWVRTMLGESWWVDLLATGILEGAGSVLTFVPQIVVLFFVLDFLEDSGYLARGAMLIDKPLSKIGLNGRSFVPMLSGFACAIPAIMAARTIPNKRERLLTIFIIPLMTCSARLPVYGLLLAFLLPANRPWLAGIILSGIYLLSLLNGAVTAGIVSRLSRRRELSPLMLELPAYRKPVLKHIVRHTIFKSYSYIQKAGPTILACAIVIWVLTYFPGFTSGADGSAPLENRLENSIAADIGRLIEPAMKPLGWDWRVGVGLLSAFMAREVFVSSMALTFQVEGESEDQTPVLSAMRQATRHGSEEPLFTTANTIALLIFFMYSMQCVSTLAVCRKETGSWRIPLLQQVIYTLAAYLLALGAKTLLNGIGIA